MSIFAGLGRSLRWMREGQAKRQYQVAAQAGITKAMLSAYETGKQKPSLDTLEKILAALGSDLNDLHNAVQIVNERPEQIRKPSGARHVGRRGAPAETAEAGSAAARFRSPADGTLYAILQLDTPLPREMEEAMSEMLAGFHKLLRYLHATSLRPPGSSGA
jgi:transcriptional regulator with XRE-family HTH domain